MTKRAISVTLSPDNLLWLKGQTEATDVRSVSELMDRIIADARTGGHAAAVRSVAGTIDIDPADPALEGADTLVRQVFKSSLSRPIAKSSGSKKPVRPTRRG
jgi:hypothetical protein